MTDPNGIGPVPCRPPAPLPQLPAPRPTPDVRRRWLAPAVGLLLLALALGLGGAFGRPQPRARPQSPPQLPGRTYTAFALVRVARQQPRILPGPPESHDDFLVYLRTQAAILRSRPVLWEMLKREEIRLLDLESRFADPVAWLEKNLRVDCPGDTEFIRVSLSGADARVVVTLVKALTTVYIDAYVEADCTARARMIADVHALHEDLRRVILNRRENLPHLPPEEREELEVTLAAWGAMARRLADELERLKVEVRAAPRVSLYSDAELAGPP